MPAAKKENTKAAILAALQDGLFRLNAEEGRGAEVAAAGKQRRLLVAVRQPQSLDKRFRGVNVEVDALGVQPARFGIADRQMTLPAPESPGFLPRGQGDGQLRQCVSSR